MHDQADELRQLVRQGTRAGQVRAPRWVTVFGGKGGVGTTSVSLGIAASLALAGRRVVLVDGDFAGPDLASMTGIDPRYTICHVLASRRSVHEALEPGPRGMQLLLGPSRDQRSVECTATAQERLVEQLCRLGAHADVVIVDAGAAVGRAMRRFWQAADDLLLVMTPDPLAVTDTYSALKQLYTREPDQLVHALVNLAADLADGSAVGERFAETCRRFLALSLASLYSVAHEPQLAVAPGLSSRTDEALSQELASNYFDGWVESWLAAQNQQQTQSVPSRDGDADDFSRDRNLVERCELSL